MRRPWLIGGVLFALALVARWPGLERSLWYDELFTLVHFTGSLGDALTRQVAANNHPPASLLAWGAKGLGAGSEWALRLPFWILGALAAPALLCWRRLIGERAALIAASLAVVAPFHASMAQQVRGYAGLLLLATLFPPALERAHREERGWALAVVTALAVWTHLSGAILAGVALVGVAWWSARAVALRALGLGLGGGLLLAAPILQRTLRYGRRALLEGDPGAGARLGHHDVAVLAGGDSLLLALALLGLSVWGAWRGRRNLLWLALPVVGAGLVILLRAPAYPRFLLIALPSLLALAAVGLTRLPQRWQTLLALGACLVTSAAVLQRQSASPLQDYRGAARTARALAPAVPPLALQPGDALLLSVYGGDSSEVADLETLAAWLDQPGPRVVIDSFPRLTPEEWRRALRRRCGPPLVLPGQHPVAVYFRS